MPTRNERLDTLRMIISNNKIKTQQELVALLQEYDIVVNQSTLSRDLLKIRAQKSHGANNCYIIPNAERYKRVYDEIQKTAPHKPTIDELINKVDKMAEELALLKKDLQLIKEQDNSAKD